MAMRIFLLLSAVAQLATPALLPQPHQPKNKNLTDFKNIFDVVENCIPSPTQDVFVDDVTHLTEGRNRCGDKFFCKTHDILHSRHHFCANRDQLVRTLKAYIKNRNVQCENATTTAQMVKISKVLKSVRFCAQQRSFRGS